MLYTITVSLLGIRKFGRLAILFMCNAHNHIQPCYCGFGGDGHLGKRTTGNINVGFIIDRLVFDSYTIPNARCPVCGAPVFFYQSPYGGRVFFDELGPPWPKHPCTSIEPIHVSERIVTQPEWIKEGWSPFKYISHHYRNIQTEGLPMVTKLYLDGYYIKDGRFLYDLNVECNENFIRRSFLFIREVSENRYEIASLNNENFNSEIIVAIQGEPLSFRGFRFQ